MRLSISQETTYRFEDEVRSSIQYLRLTPHDTERQHVLSWQLDLPRQVRPQLDPFGNVLHVLSLEGPHACITIRARGQVDINEALEAEHERPSPLPYLRTTTLTEAEGELRDFAHASCGSKRDRTGLLDLMEALGTQMTGQPGADGLGLSATDAFAQRSSACHDQAHAFLACARVLGVPARYVSGYLYTPGSDRLADHAWAEAWLDGAWYSFDIAQRLARPERHLKLAVGLDHLDACPVRAMRRAGGIRASNGHVEVTPSPSLKVAEQ
ncbi:transglutaminase family protein [Pseudomonas sp. RIT-PI-S]|uniref:transglutaminase family protein n=1 Tax=Pseudomonas sp. RIT-PI-S TaxID=3035295 RepID=UPI0021DAA953|nr:transglutaminase family protein [Pseudomonas sp. RIT-PI-S]